MYFKTPILGSFVFSKLANFVVMQNSTSVMIHVVQLEFNHLLLQCTLSVARNKTNRCRLTTSGGIKLYRTTKLFNYLIIVFSYRRKPRKSSAIILVLKFVAVVGKR